MLQSYFCPLLLIGRKVEMFSLGSPPISYVAICLPDAHETKVCPAIFGEQHIDTALYQPITAWLASFSGLRPPPQIKKLKASLITIMLCIVCVKKLKCIELKLKWNQ